MKWIGQHIWDLTSRFRNDVYITDGKLGIGTTSPHNKAHITSSGNQDGLLLDLNTGSSGDYTGVYFKVDNNTTNAYKKGGLVWERTGSYNEGRFHFLLNNEDNVNNVDLTDSKFTILSTGNVGIGTTSPTSKLQVDGNVAVSNLTSSGYLKLGADDQIISDGSITIDIDYNNNQTDRVFSVRKDNTTELFRVQENGRVGIGTTSPTDTLTINASTASGIVLNNASGSLVAKLYHGGTTGNEFGRFYLKSLTTSSEVYLAASGNSYINSGNVGIGTSNPAKKLHISDPSRVDIKFTKVGSEEHYIRKDGDYLRFRGHDDSTVLFELKNNTNGSNAASFPSGNLGVGTSSPTYKLDVAGDGIRATRSTAGWAGWFENTGNSSGVVVTAGVDSGDAPLLIRKQDGTELFSVRGNGTSWFKNGNVGIGTSSPSAKLEVTGNAVITGDLTVQGTTVTLDTTNLNVEDKNITLNYSTGDSSGSADGAGITIQDAVDASNDATMLWNASSDRFDFSHPITAKDSIRFVTSSGTDGGLIDMDSNDDLVISNPLGGIFLGNGTDDIYIGDGTSSVDIRFEQNMSIYADSSTTRTLTIGGPNTNLVLDTPSFSGTVTLGATSINNKLTFTTSNGYILFDYEPVGDTGEYTTEVPLLKVDHNGTEKTILSRISENGGIQLGHDDSVLITAGDVGDEIKSNWGATNENVVLASEAGFYALAFPNNSTTWSNRNIFRFYGGSATATENGLYIGDGSSTQFIDLDRNLKNINTITATGDFNLTNGFYLAHNEGIRIGETGNASTSWTTLTSFTNGGNSAMKIKGGNYIHHTLFETTWNDFLYAKIVSSYSGTDSSFNLYKSDSSANTVATTTISTGTSSFAGTITANSDVDVHGTLRAHGGSLLIEDTDSDNIHGQINSNSTEGVLRLRNGANWGMIARGISNSPRLGAYHNGYLSIYGFGAADGADHADDDELARFDFANERFDVNGEIRGDSLDIDGNADISGNLTINSTYPRIFLTDSNHNDDWSIINNDGKFGIYNDTDTSYALTINGSNNVGIGTTSPTTKLEIKSPATNSTPFQITNSLDTDAIFSILEDGGGDGRARIYNASGTLNVNLDSSGNSYFNGGNVGIGTTSPSEKLDVAGNIRIGDNNRIKIGNGGDMYLQHDGSNSVIVNTNGNLTISNQADDGDIKFSSDDGSGGVAEYFRLDGALGYTRFWKHLRLEDNVELRVGTSSHGITLVHDGSDSTITNAIGNLTITNFQDDGDIIFKSDDGTGSTTEYFRIDGGDESIKFYKDISNQANANLVMGGGQIKFSDAGRFYAGDSNDLQIYHDGSNSYIVDAGTGDLLNYFSNEWKVIKYGSSETCIEATSDGSVDLYYDNSKKLETTSTGVEVTGDLTVNGDSVQTKQMVVTTHNFQMANTTGTFFYVPFNNLNESSVATSAEYWTRSIAPYAGTIKKVIVRSHTSLGSSCQIRVSKITDTTDDLPSGTHVTNTGIDISTANTSVSTTMSTNTFAEGDVVGVALSRSAGSSARVVVTIVWEYTV